MHSPPPEYLRELIRLANRDGLNADDVKDLLDCTVIYDGTQTVKEFFASWKESFDEPA